MHKKIDLLKIQTACGFEFEFHIPPNTDESFQAAARFAATTLDDVAEQVIPYFLDTANDVIRKGSGGTMFGCHIEKS